MRVWGSRTGGSEGEATVENANLGMLRRKISKAILKSDERDRNQISLDLFAETMTIQFLLPFARSEISWVQQIYWPYFCCNELFVLQNN